jgi:hypothetical protein
LGELEEGGFEIWAGRGATMGKGSAGVLEK